ncbi:MAG: hypothetical protein WA913_06215 [Pricia sp.]
MKLHYFVLYMLFFALFSSFGATQACEYAGSNIAYVKTETEKAMAMNELQQMRFHIYKALGAIAKSDKQLKECGCEDASELIFEVHETLKNATKTTSTAGTRILLEKALLHAEEGLEALHNHANHGSTFGTDELQVNTATDLDPDSAKETRKKTVLPPDEELLKQKIDSSLTRYSASLDKVVRTVDCKEARAFATRIYENCEQQLLRPELSEGKKYYNLRTKEITAKALERLQDCGG